MVKQVLHYVSLLFVAVHFADKWKRPGSISVLEASGFILSVVHSGIGVSIVEEYAFRVESFVVEGSSILIRPYQLPVALAVGTINAIGIRQSNPEGDPFRHKGAKGVL